MSSTKFFILILFALFCSNVSAANDRIALVIGNSKYSELGTLSNTVNDARGVSKSLTEMGYKTKFILDAKENELRRDLKAFANESDNASIAVVYYAGHGAQVNGENYLLPVDIDIPKRESDIQLSAIKVDDIVNSLRAKTKVIFLDACRDNPALVKSLSKGRGSYRGGLAPASSSSLNDQSSGIFIAYATDAGNVALDGSGQLNSPFTSALLRYIKQPVSIDDMFSMVTKEVKQETKNQQKPYKYASLEGIVCLPGECKPINSDIPSPSNSIGKDIEKSIAKNTPPKSWVLYGFLVNPEKKLTYVDPHSITKDGNRVVADLKWVTDSSSPRTDYLSAVYDCKTKFSGVFKGKTIDSSGKVIFDQVYGDQNTVQLATDLSDPNSPGYSVVGLFCDSNMYSPVVTPNSFSSDEWVRFYTIREGEDMFYLKKSIKKSSEEGEVTVRFNFSKELPIGRLKETNNIYTGYDEFSTSPLVQNLVGNYKFQCKAGTNYASIENFTNERGELVAYFSFQSLPIAQRLKTEPSSPFGLLSKLVCN